MIEEFAKDFWQQRARATDGSIRWTDDGMLRCDLEVVGAVVPQGASLLDLGCGTGDVFLPFLDRLGHVTAVDMVAELLDRIPDDPRITRIVSAVDTFRPARTYDVALLFGVVTYLGAQGEEGAYATLRAACPAGTVVVKNQCGRDGDLLVDRLSDAFGSRYVGWYPGVEAQADRLRRHFTSVEVVPYPESVNKWPDSAHFAFVCR